MLLTGLISESQYTFTWFDEKCFIIIVFVDKSGNRIIYVENQRLSIGNAMWLDAQSHIWEIVWIVVVPTLFKFQVYCTGQVYSGVFEPTIKTKSYMQELVRHTQGVYNQSHVEVLRRK